MLLIFKNSNVATYDTLASYPGMQNKSYYNREKKIR